MISGTVRGSVVLPLAVVGLIGNLFVILVIGAKRRLHTMHFFLLANLSLSDFLFHIILFFNAINFISENSLLGTPWCQGTPYLLRCFLVTTIFLLCAVTWECHTAVVTPYQFSSEITVKKVAVVFILWVASFLFAVVSIILAGRAMIYNDKTLECELDSKRSNKSKAVLFIATTLVFIIPFGLIGKQQYQIRQAVKHQLTQIIQQQQPAINANNPEGQQQQIFLKNVKKSKDAFIIVVAFLVSYLPLFVMAGLRARFGESDAIYNAVFGANVLIQAGSTWNLVIYCFRKRQFRQQCLQLVCKSSFKGCSSQVSPQ